MTELAASTSLFDARHSKHGQRPSSCSSAQRIQSTPLDPFRPSCQSLFCCLDSTRRNTVTTAVIHYHSTPHYTTLLQLSSTRTSPPTPNTNTSTTTTTLLRSAPSAHS
jgi:hypothetical protein